MAKGEVCRIRMDRHIRCLLPAVGRRQHHTVKGKPMHRPQELAPSSILGCTPATPGIIPFILEEALCPHLSSLCLHPAPLALPSTAVAQGVLQCFDLQHTWRSVPRAHPAVIIWVPHTAGFPSQREGGLELPRAESGAPQPPGPPSLGNSRLHPPLIL